METTTPENRIVLDDGTRVPTSHEIYEWNVRAFGVGVDQNYALIIHEEVGELAEVLAAREAGASFDEWLPEFVIEVGDVAIALLCIGAGQGWEVDLAMTGGGAAARSVGGPLALERELTASTGRVSRAVLKRVQGIRESPQYWSGQGSTACRRALRVLAGLAAAYGLQLPRVVAQRFATVSTRDAVGHRPTDEVASGMREVSTGPESFGAEFEGSLIDPSYANRQFLSEGPTAPDGKRWRVGDRCDVGVWASTTYDEHHYDEFQWWAGQIVQFGPASATHDLPAIMTGGIRVTLEDCGLLDEQGYRRPEEEQPEQVPGNGHLTLSLGDVTAGNPRRPLAGDRA